MKFKKILFFYCLLLAFFHLPAFSDTITEESPPPVAPVATEIGVLPTKINEKFQTLANKTGLKNCKEKEIKDEESEDKESEDDKDKKKVTVKSKACSNEVATSFYYETIDKTCSSSKAEAKDCCENPSNCSNIKTQIITGAAVYGPQLMGIIKQYKTRADVQKNPQLTEQEISDKICNADNKSALYGFASGIVGQFAPLLEKTCAKKIKQCKKKCNAVLTAFKHNFNIIINEVMNKNYNIKNIVNLAKECMYGSEDQNFESIHFNPVNDKTNEEDKAISFSVNETRYYIYNPNLYKEKRKEKCTKNVRLTDDEQIQKFFSQVLFYSKIYSSMLLQEKQSFVFQEEEFIKCANIPNRILTQDPRQNASSFAHLTNPQIRICQNIVEATLAQGTPPPKLPTNELTPPPRADPNLTSYNSRTPVFHSPLITQSDPDSNGLLGMDGFPPEDPPPELGPGTGFGSKGSNSSGGGVSGGGSGGGSLSSNDTGGQDYTPPDYGSSGTINGNFASSNTDGYGYGGDPGYGADDMIYDREPSGDDEEDDSDPNGFGFEDGQEGKYGANSNIFEMASQKIKYFCSNQKCTQ